MTTAERIPTGVGSSTLLLPPRWVPVAVERGALTGVPDDRALAAAGVAEEPHGTFASNVMIFRGHSGIDLPPEEFGIGTVWHDSIHAGPVSRIVIRFDEQLARSIVVVHLWVVVADEPLYVAASLASERFAETWPTVRSVVESLLEGTEVGWGRWF